MTKEKRGNLFVISAPSGTGKTSIMKPILAELPRISFSVSHTTRPPRAGEIDGVDYFFVDKKDFLQSKEKNSFLEWAEVHGNYYGTSRETVESELNKGNDIILDIDVQGAKLIKENGLTATYIFIVPPSWQELEKRLTDRQTESAENIQLRLQNARLEMQEKDLYDYIIVNDKLSEAIDIMRAIIIEKRAKNRRSLDGSNLSMAELS